MKLLVDVDGKTLMLSREGEVVLVDGSIEPANEKFLENLEQGFFVYSKINKMVFGENHEDFVKALNRLDEVAGENALTEEQRTETRRLLVEIKEQSISLADQVLQRTKEIKAKNSKISNPQARKDARKELYHQPTYLSIELRLRRNREALVSMYGSLFKKLNVDLSLTPERFDLALKRIDPFQNITVIKNRVPFKRGEKFEAVWRGWLLKQKWELHQHDRFTPPLRSINDYRDRALAFARSDAPEILSRFDETNSHNIKFDPRTNELLVLASENDNSSVWTYFIADPRSPNNPRGHTEKMSSIEYFFRDSLRRFGDKR